MSNTQDELLAGVRWALAQAMRQWAMYANEKRHEPGDVDLGAADTLEDDTYNRALEIMERLGAAAGEWELIAASTQDRVRLQRVGRLAARWRDAARLVETLADHTDPIEAAKMTTAAEQMRCCADALDAEMAGSGPTESSSAATGREEGEP